MDDDQATIRTTISTSISPTLDEASSDAPADGQAIVRDIAIAPHQPPVGCATFPEIVQQQCLSLQSSGDCCTRVLMMELVNKSAHWGHCGANSF